MSLFPIKAETETGVICTIGPACDDPDILSRMLAAGMRIARLNCSHGTHADHHERLKALRAVAGRTSRKIQILVDLEGFRIRVGHLDHPITITKGQRLVLSNASVIEQEEVIPFDYSGDQKKITKGAQIFVDDGKIVLEVTTSTSSGVTAEVLVGGILHSRKGMNIPDLDLEVAGLTEKDVRDLKFARDCKADFVAQSFVRNAEDIHALRSQMERVSLASKIVAKIECESAVRHIDEIIDASDMIMVARGDMGVVMPIQQVPFIQKEIILKCRAAGVPVITATQMLESMTENVIPTRAEVADIANAILDGTDYVMLSGETAGGKHPDGAVKMMTQIVQFSESYNHASQFLILSND